LIWVSNSYRLGFNAVGLILLIASKGGFIDASISRNTAWPAMPCHLTILGSA